MIDEQRVELVARAMCRAEGLDPNDFERAEDPNWHNYRRRARAFVAAFDAAGATLTPQRPRPRRPANRQPSASSESIGVVKGG
jgi:hypothetical protein